MSRAPARVNVELTRKMRSMYALMPLLSPETPLNVQVFAVKQRCGRSYYAKRMITVPEWAILRGKGEGFDLYYLAHELAHIADDDAKTRDRRRPHGPTFMHWFQKLCPVQHQHYELGYKPRSAAAAGISHKVTQ